MWLDWTAVLLICQTWTRDKFPWIVFSSSTSAAFDRARIRKRCEVGVHKTKSESLGNILSRKVYFYTPTNDLQLLYCAAFFVPKRFTLKFRKIWIKLHALFFQSEHIIYRIAMRVRLRSAFVLMQVWENKCHCRPPAQHPCPTLRALHVCPVKRRRGFWSVML